MGSQEARDDAERALNMALQGGVLYTDEDAANYEGCANLYNPY